LGTKLFDEVPQQLLAHGYQARYGQIIDASLVHATSAAGLPERAARSRSEASWLACTYPEERRCKEPHFGDAEEAQSPYRHAPYRSRTRVRRISPDGLQPGALSGSVRTTFALNLEDASYNLSAWCF